MSASRIPAFSPMAAKPRARLQEVVDLPTPPLPDATAMMCLTPGSPAAFEVARACRFGDADTDYSLRSQGIAFLRVACTQIVLCGHHGWALRRRVRIKTLVHDRFDATVRAHLDDVETFGVGALEHPVLVAEFCQHTVDGAFGAERLAAANAEEWLFLLQDLQRRIPGAEIEARLQRDDLLGAGRLAK